MDLTVFSQMILSILLILLNGFFVLAEFGIVKVRHTQLNSLIIRGNRNAKITQEIISKLDYYLNACQLGITIASIGLGWIGEPVVARVIESLLPGLLSGNTLHVVSFAIAFAVIAYLHIVLGELVPKSIAIRKPLSSALYSAIPLYVFSKIFFLPLVILNRSSNLILRMIGVPPEMTYHIAYSEEEFRAILSESQEQGSFSLNRLFITENALNFGKITVSNIMTPIEKMAVLFTDIPWEENLKIIIQYKRSRYPLCQGDRNNILGFVHLKDILISNLKMETSDNLRNILRPIYYIKPNMLLEDLLREFQKRKIQIALINSDKGQAIGFLSFEDIVEELIGEVQDEFTTETFMHLSDLINKDGIVSDLGATSKKEAINILIKKAAVLYPELNEKELVDEVWKREAMLSTAIGRELAIPHARVAVSKSIIVFGRSKKGIDFSAPDQLPVKIIFLAITPSSTPIMQLRILAKIAKVSESSIFKQKLMEAKNEAAIFNVIRLADFSYPVETNL
ncbi:MAG: CNNM domain-containing protein [Candidatus Firestonebacteria bacterium]|nr:CNNM domain-containing protein [Candidatus Firestonebacteria bacterium]